MIKETLIYIKIKLIEKNERCSKNNHTFAILLQSWQ